MKLNFPLPRSPGMSVLALSFLLLAACGKEPASTSTADEKKIAAPESLEKPESLVKAGDSPPVALDLKSLKLNTVPPSSALLQGLRANKLIAFGSTYPADVYCNDDTMGSPDDIEVFQIQSHSDVVVYLCSGSLDGQENTISVFAKGKKPQTTKRSPAATTYRISDKVLLATVKKLLASQ